MLRWWHWLILIALSVAPAVWIWGAAFLARRQSADRS
jgi:hypothetical protein